MRRFALLFVALALVAAGPAAAVNVFWTSVGSAGTVDPASVVPFYNGAAIQYPAASTATQPIIVRYNVTDTNLNNDPAWTTLEVGTAGIAATDTVQVTLFSVGMCSETITEVCQVVITGSPICPAECQFSSSTFDFSTHAYFIQAVLSRTSTSVNPQLFYLSIH
jgi:hypothetical protein